MRGTRLARTQAQRKTETRQRLLGAAALLFAREGYDATSVDAIGDVAERTSGSVYAHFGNKEGVLLALLEGFQDHLAAVVEAEFATRPDLPTRLHALWSNIVDHPDGDDWFLLEVELWLHAARHPDRAPTLRARYEAIHTLMRDEFARWVDEFDLEPLVAIDALPQAVMATVMGLAMQHRIVPDATSDEHAVTMLTALFGYRPL